jgi:general secretion pathway protein D
MKRLQSRTRFARTGGKAILVGAAILAAAFTIASAQSGGELITPNFKDADIGQVAQAVALATHKNFVLDPRVRAQVTMLSTTPMSPAAFYQTFLAILQVHGFIAVPSGDVVKIVPDAEERYMPANTLPSQVSSSSDEIVTQVVKVNNMSAEQLVPVLRPLIPNQAQLSAYGPANILIISDRAANVSRLIRIIHRIDQSDTSNIDVIPLQNASATQVARVVSQLYQGAMQNAIGGGSLRLIADERSNSILLSGNATARLQARALIAHLDTPSAYGGNTQVRYLKYEDAKKLAPKLKQQLQAMQEAAAAAKGGTTGEQSTQSNAQIWADEQNNALVITAPPKTMSQINAIIDKLDIRRPQVLVQAIIVDVDANKANELGVNWAVYSNGSTIPGATFLTPVGGASLIDLAGAIQSPTSLTDSSGLANGATLALGSLAKTGTSFAAMLRALQSNEDSNIIATPSMVTMDHQEATIQVAEQVPFITGQYSTTTAATTSGTVTPFQTIENETVGTTLKITPDINSNDSLILKIHIESSSLLPASSAGGSAITTVDPTTSKRSVDTEVLVRNGSILVIGGLISNEYDRTESGVPLLSHIPLLGLLFKDREGSLEKKDLMIFIRPQILNTGAEATEATDAEYQFIRKQQQAVGEKERIPLLPGAESSVLPAPPSGVAPSKFTGCCDIAPISAPPPHAPQTGAAGSAPASPPASASGSAQ